MLPMTHKCGYLVPSLVVVLFGLAPVLAAAQTAEPPRRGPAEREVFFLGPGPWQPPATYLGVRTLELTPELRAHFGAPEDRGLMVSWLQAEGPAARAGVRVGDILATLDTEPVATTRDLLSGLGDREPGETVVVELWRDGRLLQLSVALDERPGRSGRLGRYRWRGPDASARLEEIHRHLEERREALEEAGLSQEALERLEARMRESLEGLEIKLRDPELRGRLRIIHAERGKLERRVRELEQRIEQLERELARERGEG